MNGDILTMGAPIRFYLEKWHENIIYSNRCNLVDWLNPVDREPCWYLEGVGSTQRLSLNWIPGGAPYWRRIPVF